MRVELKYYCTQQMVNVDDMAIIMLTDCQEKRQVSILCDIASKYQLDLRSHSVRIVSDDGTLMGPPPSELTRLMLPEVLCSIINYMTDLKLQVVITNVYDGNYQAVIEDANTGTTFPVRASDAVLLAVANKHIPIFIEETLWEYQSLPLMKESTGIAIPINTLTLEMLDASLERAIENENYEQAKQLKEEIERRKAK